MANLIKSASKAISKAAKAEAKQGEREFAKALRSTAKQARKSAQPAITSFVAEGDAYVSKGGKYLRSIGGTGKYTDISKALFNRAKDVADAAKPAEKIKEGAEGALGGIRGKMDAFGTRASERFGVSKNIGNAIAGGTVGGATGMVVGGTIAAVDGNDNTSVIGGALGGAFIGGAAGGLYGGLMGFEKVAKEIAEGEAVNGVEQATKDIQNANDYVINNGQLDINPEMAATGKFDRVRGFDDVISSDMETGLVPYGTETGVAASVANGPVIGGSPANPSDIWHNPMMDDIADRAFFADIQRRGAERMFGNGGFDPRFITDDGMLHINKLGKKKTDQFINGQIRALNDQFGNLDISIKDYVDKKAKTIDLAGYYKDISNMTGVNFNGFA